MKYVYEWNCKAICLTAVILICQLTGINDASAQAITGDTKAAYVPVNSGKVMPNVAYADPRQKTRFVYDANNTMTRLPEQVVMHDLYLTPGNDGIVIRWRTTWEPDNLKLYEIEFSSDGIHFQQAGVIPAGNYLNGKGYEFRHFPVNVRDRLFYRIRMTDKNGRYDYSPLLTLAATTTTQNYIFPTIVNAGMVSVYLNDSFRMLQIVNSQGAVLQTQILNGKTGRTDISLNIADQGIYFVRILGQSRDKDIVQKIFIR